MYIYIYIYIYISTNQLTIDNQFRQINVLAVQILHIKKPHFKHDAFRIFSLKFFLTVHCSILSAIKIVIANFKGINLKGLHSRCSSVEERSLHLKDKLLPRKRH